MCSVNQLSEQLPARPREGAHCRLEERSEEDQRKKEAKEKRTGQQGTETGKVVNPTTLFQQDFLSSPQYRAQREFSTWASQVPLCTFRFPSRVLPVLDRTELGELGRCRNERSLHRTQTCPCRLETLTKGAGDASLLVTQHGFPLVLLKLGGRAVGVYS